MYKQFVVSSLIVALVLACVGLATAHEGSEGQGQDTHMMGQAMSDAGHASGDMPMASGGSAPHMAGAAVQPVRESLAEHFDATGYLAMNPDVAASGMNPLAHWTASGRAEGRQPNAFFDPDFYLGQHPELGQMTEFQAWRHFMDAGMQGGWLPNEHFDAAFYAAHNPDVAGSGMSPVQHYVAVGWAEGRNPYPDFDPDAYLADHPEVVGAGYDHASALNQYLAEGQCRGAAY